MIRSWIMIAISDIISLYTINPTTLYGTVNIGPNLQKDYVDESGERTIIDLFSEEQVDDFVNVYKSFAVYAYGILTRRLEHITHDAIDMGYSDITCELVNFQRGMLQLRITPIDNSHLRKY